MSVTYRAPPKGPPARRPPVHPKSLRAAVLAVGAAPFGLLTLGSLAGLFVRWGHPLLVLVLSGWTLVLSLPAAIAARDARVESRMLRESYSLRGVEMARWAWQLSAVESIAALLSALLSIFFYFLR
jgi:hypothetical protein